MLFLLLLSISLASPPAARTLSPEEGSACLDTTPKAIEAARALEQAFLDAEEDQFLSLHRELQHQIQCMISPPGSALEVAGLHRAMAIWQFVSGQHAASRASFGSVRRLQPMWSIDTWGLPEGHQLRHLFSEAPTDRSRKTLRSPPGGWLIDGKPDTTMPAVMPALVQGFYADQSLWYAGIVSSIEIPELPIDETRVLRRRKTIRIGGSVAGGTLVLTSAALLGVASVQRGALKNGDIPYNKIGQVTNSVNALTATGITLGAVGGISLSLTWAFKW